MWRKVLWPPSSPLDLGCSGVRTRTSSSSGKKSVDPVVTLVALLSVTIWSWASLWRGVRRNSLTTQRWRYVRLQTYQLGDLWAYCSTRGVFIISLRCMANGWCGPFFFSFPPYRRQYHSSDLSPFACLNVWKQDVLRLLALLGKAGMLIPHPRGAQQYGAARWPPASPGSRCHNTSHIPPNNQRHRLLFRHTSINAAAWVTAEPHSRSRGSSVWNNNKKLSERKLKSDHNLKYRGSMEKVTKT